MSAAKGPADAVDTVLLDLGQVLVRWDPRPALRPAPGGGHDGAPELTDAALEAFVDGPFRELNGRLDRAARWTDLRPAVVRSAPEHVALMDRYVARYPASLGGPVPGTHELVVALRERGTRLFGLTNWSGELFRHAAPAAPAVDLLEDVLVSGREGVSKPDPTIFRRAVDRFGLVPGRTLFVDDSAANVEAAAALGFRTLLFLDAAGLQQTLTDLGLLA